MYSQHKVSRVSCGMDHTAAITDNTIVWTWGKGTNGQLVREAHRRRKNRDVDDNNNNTNRERYCFHLSRYSLPLSTIY